MTGCGQLVWGTTDSERKALVDFYTSMQGSWWRFSYNWLVGDPCLNLWYGIQCDSSHHIISIHFFQNHLNGVFPSSFKDLIYLRHLSIFNDGREYENNPVYHMNTVYAMDSQLIAQLTKLEELNLANLDMYGFITADFVKNLKRLRFLNLSHNRLEKALPQIEDWANWTEINIIELTGNRFTGSIPPAWAKL